MDSEVPRETEAASGRDRVTALHHSDEEIAAHQRLVWPAVRDFIVPDLLPSARVLDAGCGNGTIAGWLLQQGYRVTGVDASESGIDICRRTHASGTFHLASFEDSRLLDIVGGPSSFDAIVSVEVVEHLYAPAAFLATCRRLLVDDGVLVVTTPYHGYLKNLAIAALGRFDTHWGSGHEGGHIKFWSRRTITAKLMQAGFEVVDWRGCGRVPYLWRSMAVKARSRA